MSDTDEAIGTLRLVEPKVMSAADTYAVRMGIALSQLISRAAQAITQHIGDRTHGLRIAILAGPGNNGGDGVAVQELLSRAGANVHGFAFGRSDVDWASIESFQPESYDFVVDALFGGGLTRDVTGEVADAIRRLNASSCHILSVDLPSGIDGASGAERGVAIRADETLTFVRMRPGHLLMPGRECCGTVTVSDIGMPDAALLEALADQQPLWRNTPDLWTPALRMPTASGHKFDRGHAIVLGGGASHTGAARMTAMAALRAGAGLVTLLSPGSAMMVNAAHLTAVMLQRCDDAEQLTMLLSDDRLNAAAIGPGFGIGAAARDCALALLGAERKVVLDADALTSFQASPEALFGALGGKGDCVLTPHGGEFARLFPDIAAREAAKPAKARAAAQRAGAVVVLKGADTVIAAPDGRAAVNATGTSWLATAGSGDVLGGIILGQLASGVPAFEAACAGVWMHGRAAELFGPGLIAEDLPGLLPAVLRELV
ncbi:NAD(P)H-hydrate dehydratase [Aureimonas jatrophae]|uniref:Bifunctional NAD(P)H-hydrate repair enzyme n=1 Tax=Aureimonas jatrophae TaxID=1166073 RepID=A0A1H0MEY1_9HYPH|nr:NAD(P)H-hydrate dehydratase [Aureimonas jatrophae]MBB3951080.1 NAD(P)H-hydrate epimerase [Aureimonas jatrophae]SDO78927.1 yjeF C-terminal region, hydroxyethylthiazole kinase-related/yjeF N-terminal region [Aureimonas jatrophae]